MKLANGVEMLEITMNIMGKSNPIHPTLIWDEDTVILADAGYPGVEGLAKMHESMLEAGVSWDKLSKVIVTHQDIDHIGGLPGIVRETQGKVEVLAHEGDKPYIQGEKRLIKITPEVLAQMDTWPEVLRKAMKPILENPPKANVDRVVEDREELHYGGGIIVIHTPGHTPGHICLYLKQSKTLIAGDTMNVVDGQLFKMDSHLAFDTDLAAKSLKKLTQYDIETVVCYHGGVFKENVNQRIAELANVE